MRGDGHERVGSALRAEPAPAVFRHEDEIFGIHADESGESRNDEALALAGAVEVALSILPVRHGAPRLHGVVRGAGGHEALVEHQGRLGEPLLDVSERPLRRRLAHRQLPLDGGGEVVFRPFDLLHTLPGDASVALDPGIRASRAQTLERVHRERERFQIHLDLADRVLGGGFVDRSDGEDRITDEDRLVRENRIAGRRNRRNVVGGENCDDALHRHRLRRIDAADPAVRHRAREKTAEEHAVRPEVLCVLGPSRHFGADIRRREVLSDQLGHLTPPSQRA